MGHASYIPRLGTITEAELRRTCSTLQGLGWSGMLPMDVALQLALADARKAGIRVGKRKRKIPTSARDAS
jgi:hypothetical protein